MKSWMKASVCIGLSLVFCFLTIGYAAITTTLNIDGKANIDIPYGLFIVNIEEVNGTRQNIDKNEFEHLLYTTTVKSLINKGSNAGSVTYRITVLNNTRLTYSYRGIYYQTTLSDYDGNSYISKTDNRNKISIKCSLDDKNAVKKVEPNGGTLTFTVTYTVGRSLSSTTDWKTLINYQFGINVDGEAEALEVVEQKFLDILNTPSTYTELTEVLDDKFDGRQEWTSNYIGNVVDSSSEDSMKVNTLFAGQLQITVGNDEMDATVLIKHENLDGNIHTGDDYTAVNKDNGGVFRGYGCEMTLYLTIDPLNRAGQYVPVYAVVFTCDRDAEGKIDGEWYRVGDTYAGEANVVTYNGGNGTGSFVTDNWRADAATHTVVDGYNYTVGNEKYTLAKYSYNVGNDVNIESIVMAQDENARNTLQTLLNDAQRIFNSMEYAGTGITAVEEVFAAAWRCYTLDENGNPVVNADMTRAELIPSIRNLYSVIDMALLQMEALSKQ